MHRLSARTLTVLSFAGLLALASLPALAKSSRPKQHRGKKALGEIVSAVRRSGRQPRRRQFDLLIAAVARVNRLAVATRNPVDFAGLEDLVEVHAV